MKPTYKLLLLTVGVAWLITPMTMAEEEGNEPAELARLKEVRTTAVMKALKPVDDKFLQELENLKTKFTKAGDLESGLAVSNEIKRFQETRLLAPEKQNVPPASSRLKSGDLDGDWVGINSNNSETLEIRGLEILGDRGAVIGKIEITNPRERKVEIAINGWTDYLHVSSASDMMTGKNNGGSNTWWRKVK